MRLARILSSRNPKVQKNFRIPQSPLTDLRFLKEIRSWDAELR
jgi:hypothetical protein